MYQSGAGSGTNAANDTTYRCMSMYVAKNFRIYSALKLNSTSGASSDPSLASKSSIVSNPRIPAYVTVGNVRIDFRYTCATAL